MASKTNARSRAAGEGSNGAENARTVERTVALKPGEEIRDFRISIASAPVGGKGPRPTREAVLTLVLALPEEARPKPARDDAARQARTTGNATEAATKKAVTKRKGRPKTKHVVDSRAGTPVGGPGKKRTP